MVICEKCKRLNDCNEGQIFLELKKTMDFSVPECEIYEEKKPKKKKKKRGENNNEKTIYIFTNGWKK